MYGLFLPTKQFCSREEKNFENVCLFYVIQIPKT